MQWGTRRPVQTTLAFLVLSIAVASGFLSACSEVNTDSALALVDANGNHPDGWLQGHGPYALPGGERCVSCHGEDLEGGISGVSCATASFGGQSCHAGGPAFHPAAWLDKLASNLDFHGDAYAADPSLCRVCHDPGSPATPPGYNCLECHFSEDGTARVPAGSGYAHGDTGDGHKAFSGTPAVADVCVACHEVNNSFGYEPSCHNCHGIHPDGWADRSAHGAAAVADPGPDTGLDACRDCHGSNFAGGSAGVSCLSVSACHQVAAPHARSWRSRHDGVTDRDNGPLCGLCHLGDREPPRYQEPPAGSCFNNTLCHGAED